MRSIRLIILITLIAVPAFAASHLSTDSWLRKVIHGVQRDKAFVMRDSARHPYEELEFFGIKPDMTVVEIWPSKGYWTEILAPYLNPHGVYYVAFPVQSGDAPKMEEAIDPLQAKMNANKSVYGKVNITQLGQDHYDIAPAGSVDMILTFRNLHNWMKAGYAKEVLAGYYKALKPGGILGIEDHRAANDTPQDLKALSGYIRQDYAVTLAEQSGFEFVGSSEINANPKDTKNWPKGVWTLPPSFALGAQDHDKYEAIGEADNFVLKFKKPDR